LASTQQGEGVKRAKFLLKNGVVTYQTLKRLKNFFDYYDGSKPQEYNLSGGDAMKEFVETTLNRERDAVKRGKEIKRDLDVDQTRATKPQQTPQLSEEENGGATDGTTDGLKENALGIIVNNDNQILLMKRANDPDIWQPGKWALVGGEVEDDDASPEVACKREIKEETGLDIDKFKQKFSIQRNPDSIEHIFIAKYDGDPHAVEMNEEHTNYGWYQPHEMGYLNHVPNLIDYVNLAFKKYD
jgi:8-oxo-dGTP pyrophosphatase MutT (NUDIX family)